MAERNLENIRGVKMRRASKKHAAWIKVVGVLCTLEFESTPPRLPIKSTRSKSPFARTINPVIGDSRINDLKILNRGKNYKVG